MRINANQGAQPPAESNQNTASTKTNGRNSSSGALGEDQAQLSGIHLQVQALTAQAAQLPEAREARINALRQVVSAGNYQPGSGEVAQAIFDHMLVSPAA